VNGRQPLEGQIGWLEHSGAGIAGSIERAVFTEELARQPGWLQRVDPRAKVATFLAVVIAASASTSLGVLVLLYVATLAVARASRLPFDFLSSVSGWEYRCSRALWCSHRCSSFRGPGCWIPLGPLHLGLSAPGVWGALIFVRVGVSVSLAVLLVLTTPWADLLKSLNALRVPQVFVLVLSMTYRYIFLFWHTSTACLKRARVAS
jgi:cobalt/nickel transport system permease protein